MEKGDGVTDHGTTDDCPIALEKASDLFMVAVQNGQWRRAQDLYTQIRDWEDGHVSQH